MIELPNEIYACAQVRELDRLAIEVHGIPSYTLMRRAGAAALEQLRAHWPDARTVTIVCGAGNNAGDGYVLGRLAMEAGLGVDLVSLVAGEDLGGDARVAYDDFVAAGGVAHDTLDAGALRGDVIVDAVLGTGLTRAVEGRFATAVAAINTNAKPVLALDIPSGLDADAGQPLGMAVTAEVTITFVGLKVGLFVGVGPEHCGTVEFAGLGVPANVYEALDAPLHRLSAATVARVLPPRRRTAHKGDHGRVLLIGGAPGMSGAIRLAAEAALRAGAGLVRVATHAASVAVVSAGRPEVMSHVVDGPAALSRLIEESDVLVLGPGLGRSDWAVGLWRAALDAGLPLVLDADGLNLLAAAPERRDHWILTPHPGEAARLLGRDAADVQRDRVGAVRQIAARYGGVAVLKGAGTLIAGSADGALGLCDRGNPGMATAGMGDVLAGVLGAIAAQGADLRSAAEAGVFVHAAAGDAAAAAGERGLVAGDLMAYIRERVNAA
jgi:NAD(P)H-hydrate epimerase